MRQAKYVTVSVLGVMSIAHFVLIMRASRTSRDHEHSCSFDPSLDFSRESSKDAAAQIAKACGTVTAVQLARCKVPPIVHYTIGFKFNFQHYLAVKSAHDRIRPQHIYFHAENEFPKSVYFHRAVTEFHAILVQARFVNYVHDRVVEVPEHRGDIIRLETLIRFGGIYLDTDVIVLQPFDVFLHDEMTIPAENAYGLNNGIIIAKRCSRFLLRWYDRYKDFNDSQWAYHSVIVPLQLYQADNTGVRVERKLLKADWPQCADLIFGNKTDHEFWASVRAIHAYYRHHNTTYDEVSVMALQNNFGLVARRILAGKAGMYDG